MAKTPDSPEAHLPPEPYWQQSQRPLQSLLFLVPLLVLYELGMTYYVRLSGLESVNLSGGTSGGASGGGGYIYARSLLRDFFDWFGISSYYLPGLLVVVVLLSLHITKKDPWRVDFKMCFWMGIETLIWAFPLFIFAVVMFRSPTAWALLQQTQGQGAEATVGWPELLVRSIGAGIYEELLFRLIAIAMLHLLLVDVLRFPKQWGAIGAIVISAILFAAYHFSANNPFEWGKGLFYMGAGLYFAGVYVGRGFGIVAGTHALYDVLVVLLRLTG